MCVGSYQVDRSSTDTELFLAAMQAVIKKTVSVYRMSMVYLILSKIMDIWCTKLIRTAWSTFRKQFKNLRVRNHVEFTATSSVDHHFQFLLLQGELR